ncbi:MAG: hypothetical protein ACKVP0_04070 [Pirellulaceae bacterium]
MPPEFKELCDLCKAGKLFTVQEWFKNHKYSEPENLNYRHWPMGIAIGLGFHSLIEVLLQNGIPADGSALQVALRRRNKDIVMLLLQYGADGQHLRIYPDGRFGCAVHPKDHEHRKRIFALAGDKSPRQFTVKVTNIKAATVTAKSVTSSLTSFRGTLGTAIPDSVSSSKQASQDSAQSPALQCKYVGTLGTAISMSRAYAKRDDEIMCDHTYMCKDIESGVPSVPNPPTEGRMPYLTPRGVLGIPADSPERFHWWKGGQSIEETRKEVESRMRLEQSNE